VYNEFETYEIKFKWWLVKIIYYYEKNHLFLPSFQVDFFTNLSPSIIKRGVRGELWEVFLKKFYEIFTDIWWEDYIFDLISLKLKINNSKILTDHELANNFKTFSEKKLTIFLENIDKFFIEEKLEQNRELKFHLYYLIFLNYKLFKNILLSNWWIEELEKLLWEDIDDKFIQELSLSKEKIEHISDININIFNKYKNILENFMKLLK
jgi:hypothetical protein